MLLAKDLLAMCPYYDKETGRMWAEWRATWDRVFVWQPLAPDKIGSIIMPETVQSEYKPQIGVVVSAGAGWSDTKKFHPMFIRAGWVVIWDLRTPWRMQVGNSRGEMHELRYMGEQDIRAIVDPDQDISGIGELMCRGNFMVRAARIGSVG